MDVKRFEREPGCAELQFFSTVDVIKKIHIVNSAIIYGNY